MVIEWHRIFQEVAETSLDLIRSMDVPFNVTELVMGENRQDSVSPDPATLSAFYGTRAQEPG